MASLQWHASLFIPFAYGDGGYRQVEKRISCSQTFYRSVIQQDFPRWGKCSASVLPNTLVTRHVWLLSSWGTEFLLWWKMDLRSHTQLGATILDSTASRGRGKKWGWQYLGSVFPRMTLQPSTLEFLKRLGKVESGLGSATDWAHPCRLGPWELKWLPWKIQVGNSIRGAGSCFVPNRIISLCHF